MIIATKTDYGTDQAKKFTGRLRDTYIPNAGFGDAEVFAGGGPPTGVDFINRAYCAVPVAGADGARVDLHRVAARVPLSGLTAEGGALERALDHRHLRDSGDDVQMGGWAGIGLTQSNQIEAWIPIFLFAMLFGLSMDYEVFLLSRMREIYDETGDTTLAVTQGLEKTGQDRDCRGRDHGCRVLGVCGRQPARTRRSSGGASRLRSPSMRR